MKKSILFAAFVLSAHVAPAAIGPKTQDLLNGDPNMSREKSTVCTERAKGTFLESKKIAARQGEPYRTVPPTRAKKAVY